MPDYKELYYESQARLADLEEELKRLVLKIQSVMRESEEKILEDDGKTAQKND